MSLIVWRHDLPPYQYFITITSIFWYHYTTQIYHIILSVIHTCAEGLVFDNLVIQENWQQFFETVWKMKMRHHRVSLFELPLTMTKAIILLLRVTFNPENWWWRTDHLPKALARKVPRFVCNVPKMHQLIDALSEFECLHRVGIKGVQTSDSNETYIFVKLRFELDLIFSLAWPNL